MEKQKTHPHKIENPEHSAHPAEHKPQKEIKITLPAFKWLNSITLTSIVAIILLLIVSFQTFQAYSLTKELNLAAEKAIELKRPALLEVTTIEPDCADCIRVGTILSGIETAKVNITKKTLLSASDAEAKELIAKYGIKRLPTAIVVGELNKTSLNGFTKSLDALYFQASAPYFDVESGKVKGLVSLTYVNASSCPECSDLTVFANQLKTQAKITSFKIIDKDSAEGRKTVSEYGLARLPGILLSSEINEYPIGAQLAGVGSVKKDGSLALGASAPYFNVSTGQVSGITSLILLNDSSCKECYDVTVHKSIVNDRFAVYTKTTRTVDVSSAEGKDLIAEYKILAVPTILITGEVSLYDSLNSIWPAVGTVEKDGTYIFREMSQIPNSPYKDLATGKVNLNKPAQQ